MTRRFLSVLIAVLLTSQAPVARPADESLKLALKQAIEDTSSFKDPAQARVWLADMSNRLKHKIPDPFYRLELLRAIHTESIRVGLQPELVLSVIQVESAFDRFAISSYGARGLMQVMPFWKKEIGHPRDNLFHPQTNLRYGCTILKYYLDREKGDLTRALARYNGSVKTNKYPRRVYAALKRKWYKQ
ncbi:MAG: lytic transglycosylase domain-containing protein [Gammaproteobacteria bacterium]|nr:lytic transglycosylase domain-containing protein [Gammaproteobacteria bacterium]